MNLIDIRLVGTQILGFLVLLWALRKWAWGPVLAGLEARRQRIAGEFAEAERRTREADALRAKYEEELRGVDAQARQRIQDAIAEGQRVAGEIQVQAHADAQARLQRADEEVARQREREKELVKEKIVDLSIRTAEKILRARLDDPAQRRLAAEFIDEVGASR